MFDAWLSTILPRLWYNQPVDERAFVEQKKGGWEELSRALDDARAHGAKRLSGDQLRLIGCRYRALVSDLSFARTQQASEGLITYLNELAGRAHGVVYVSRGAKLKGMLKFFLRDFPILFRATANYTIVAALIFGLGWALSATSPEVCDLAFPNSIPKPSKAAKSDSPLWGIDPSLLSGAIMANNIKVGIHAFAGGVTAGAYTVFQLGHNGLVIGAVATKAVPAMGAMKFWSLILPHGVIELMAIFICGGAGLLMGAAIVAPGNRRRVDSMRIASREALKLFAGAVVMFVIAGIIEGFITPAPLPEWSKMVFAGLTAVGLIAYLGLAAAKKTTDDRRS